MLKKILAVSGSPKSKRPTGWYVVDFKSSVHAPQGEQKGHGICAVMGSSPGVTCASLKSTAVRCVHAAPWGLLDCAVGRQGLWTAGVTLPLSRENQRSSPRQGIGRPGESPFPDAILVAGDGLPPAVTTLSCAR